MGQARTLRGRCKGQTPVKAREGLGIAQIRTSPLHGSMQSRNPASVLHQQVAIKEVRKADTKSPALRTQQTAGKLCCDYVVSCKAGMGSTSILHHLAFPPQAAALHKKLSTTTSRYRGMVACIHL